MNVFFSLFLTFGGFLISPKMVNDFFFILKHIIKNKWILTYLIIFQSITVILIDHIVPSLASESAFIHIGSSDLLTWTLLIFIFINFTTNNMITKNGLRIKKHFSLILFSVKIISSRDVWWNCVYSHLK